MPSLQGKKNYTSAACVRPEEPQDVVLWGLCAGVLTQGLEMGEANQLETQLLSPAVLIPSVEMLIQVPPCFLILLLHLTQAGGFLSSSFFFFFFIHSVSYRQSSCLPRSSHSRGAAAPGQSAQPCSSLLRRFHATLVGQVMLLGRKSGYQQLLTP